MRINYLDFSRAILLSLGLVIHGAGYSNDSGFLLWDKAFHALGDFIHGFRMEGFFLISGFFSAMSLSKYGAMGFLKRRVTRVAVPLVVCGATLVTVLNLVDPGPKATEPMFFLKLDYWLDGGWLRHLWFLGVLLVYMLVSFALRCCGLAAWGQRIAASVTLLTFLLGIPLTRFVLHRVGWQLPGPPWGTSWVFFSPGLLLHYAPFFMGGWVLFANQALLHRLTQSPRLLLGLVGVCGPAALAMPEREPFMQVGEFLVCAYSLGMCFLLFWLAWKFFATERAWVRGLAEASYTIYLLHLPFMALLWSALSGLRLHPLANLLLLGTLTGVWCWAFHRLVVCRSRVIGFLLNGRSEAARPSRKEPAPIACPGTSPSLHPAR